MKEIKKNQMNVLFYEVYEPEIKRLMSLWNMPRQGVIKAVSELSEGIDEALQLLNKGE